MVAAGGRRQEENKMIVRPQQNWFRMLFIWEGSVLPSIIPQLVFTFLVAMLALLTHGRILGDKVPLNTAPFTMMGIALAIFLAFRNNASYARYCEARTLWGNMLIAARNLTSQVNHYVPRDTEHFDHTLFVRRLTASVYALNHQLRKTDPSSDLAPLLPGDELASLRSRCYQPLWLLDALRGMLAQARRQGALADAQLWMCDAQINEIAATIGGCERIASTPIPFPYGVLLHRTVSAYCLLLPFGLVDSIGMATPLISVFVSYTLVALEAISREVADPFGKAPNHLALDAITRNIERSLLELNGQAMPAEMRVGKGYQLT
jgi:ion channel-forming bestrophin family protein